MKPGTILQTSRVLVAQTTYLGDLVLTFPLLAALRTSLPAARIDLLVQEDLSELAGVHPAVNQVLVMKKTMGHSSMRAIWRLVQDVRRGNYDLAIVLPGSIRTALVAMLARIPRRIGWDPGSTLSGPMKHVHYPAAMRALPFVWSILWFEKLYRLSRPLRAFLPQLFTDTLDFQDRTHAAKRNLEVLHQLGCQIPHSISSPWVPIIGDTREKVSARYPSGPKGSIVLAPGAGQPTRRWPVESFVLLARLLAADGYIVYILGGESDRDVSRGIVRGAGSAGVVSVAGELTPTHSMELIRQSNAIVTNDSAPVHMASAVGTPAVALFGPTLPEFGFAPLASGSEILEQTGLPCRPCTVYGSGVCPIGTLACLESISVDAVHAAVVRAAMVRQRPIMPEP